MVWREQLGRSAEEIASEYDLTLAQVYAALAYYYEHQDEIDRRMEEDAAFAQELRRQTPSKLGQKLHGRRA